MERYTKNCSQVNYETTESYYVKLMKIYRGEKNVEQISSYLDTKDDSYELIPTSEKMKPYKVAIFFSGLERSLKNSKYNLRQDECKAAAYALMGYAGMDYDTFANTRLRDVPFEVFEAYKERLPELWRRRAEHYYSEFARAEKGAELWRKGDLEGYGQLVFESGKSSIYSYECGCDELKKLYEIMTDTDGIYGGRFSGAGFKGCCMALIDPDKAEDIEVKVTTEYLKAFPALNGKYDAIEAGFNHVVFIIRKDIEKEFKEVIGDRIASICSSHNVTVDYAFQDINDIPGTLPEGRTKPWGTGQAVLAAKDVIKTPFIVINADDYYGKEGFKAVHEYLVNGGKSCMAGFVLKNTLSDNGGVTRGICKMDEQNNLTEVVETKNIVKTADGAEADGVAVDVNSLVSMNMWGLTPDFLDVLEKGFKEFFEKEVPGNIDTLKADLKAKKAALKKAEKEVATLVAKKAKADAKAAEEAKKAEAESVLKKLLAEGMSADEILAKLK